MMRFLIICFIALFAFSNAKDCSDRAEKCVENLLSVLLEEDDEEAVCKELGDTFSCLRIAADECFEETNEEVEEGLAELKKLLKESCGNDEQNEVQQEHGESTNNEMKRCFDENEEYLFNCINQEPADLISQLAENDVVDEETMTCSLYRKIAQCFVDRTREKCGQEAATFIEEEIKDPPEEIQKSCDAAENKMEADDFQLLDKKK